MENYKYNSDMDICISGEKIDDSIWYRIIDEVDELYAPLSFDILLIIK